MCCCVRLPAQQRACVAVVDATRHAFAHPAQRHMVIAGAKRGGFDQTAEQAECAARRRPGIASMSEDVTDISAGQHGRALMGEAAE
jgi:hypothetical protein